MPFARQIEFAILVVLRSLKYLLRMLIKKYIHLKTIVLTCNGRILKILWIRIQGHSLVFLEQPLCAQCCAKGGGRIWISIFSKSRFQMSLKIWQVFCPSGFFLFPKQLAFIFKNFWTNTTKNVQKLFNGVESAKFKKNLHIAT